MTPAIEERFQSLDNAVAFSPTNRHGVYFLCKSATVIYVGSSKNIARRISSHRLTKDFDTVLVFPVPDRFSYSIEQHWIRRLRPKLNRPAREQKCTGVRIISRVISFRVSNDLYARLLAQAERRSISLSTFVEELLTKGIE